MISKARLERVVEAVADALGFEGTEAKFQAALKAAEAALTPGATGYLRVEAKGIRAHVMGASPAITKKSDKLIRNRDELVAWCQEWGVDNFMCSSSLDFPDEYTKSKKIIDLCDFIRNGEEAE